MSAQDNRARRGSTDPAFPIIVADVLDRWRPAPNGHELRRLGQPDRLLPLNLGGVRRAAVTCGHALDRRTAQRLLDALVVIVEAVAAAVAAEPEQWMHYATWLHESCRRVDGWMLAAGRPIDEEFRADAVRPKLRRGVAA